MLTRLLRRLLFYAYEMLTLSYAITLMLRRYAADGATDAATAFDAAILFRCRHAEIFRYRAAAPLRHLTRRRHASYMMSLFRCR